MFKINNRYLIKTPLGYERFLGIQKKKMDSLYTFTFIDNTFIKCSGGHAFLTDEGFKQAKEIILKNTISGKTIVNIESEFGNFEVFDPVGIEDHSSYFSNDVISHNTQFLGSMNTLIDAKKLRILSSTWRPPMIEVNDVAKYYEPEPNHAYLIVVDTSRGVGIDYHAFVVFDITEIPYKTVCVFHNNELSGLLYPNIIFSIAKHYNEAYVLIETNDNGQQIADILYNDLEYDNVLSTKMGGRSGQKLSGGFGSMKSTIGIRTSKQVKRIGCANLKSLVENDKLLIEDFGIIYELTRFVAVKSSYEADEGEHDDLVMCCVLFAWLANQDYFKEFSDTDVRNNLYGKFSKELSDDMLPFGVIDHGDDDENRMSAAEWHDEEWGFNRYTNLEIEN